MSLFSSCKYFAQQVRSKLTKYFVGDFAQGNGPRENLNIDLKSKDLIWATKDIFAKRSLVSCKGKILEFTLHGFTFFMLDFFNWIKKLVALCSHNWISRKFYIAASLKFLQGTYLLSHFYLLLHLSIYTSTEEESKGRLMLFQVFPKCCRQHLDLSLFLTDSSQDACTFGHCNSNAYKIFLEYLLYRQHFSPPFNSVNICRETSTTSYE